MVERKTIDEYIENFPDDIQQILQNIRRVIQENAPDASEKISYGMPCFWQGKNLVYFAAMKGHLGFYPTPSGVTAFADKLSEYKMAKGSVQIPWSKPVPYDLIAEITRFRVAEVTAIKP